MFFYQNWELFCAAIKKYNIPTYKARDILKTGAKGQFIIFKHDVETNPSKALRLAEIESKFGISGSYYVQAYLLDSTHNVAILQQIRDLGHEVSYHYDVLDANKGDLEKADQDFKYYIDRFESFGFSIETICQHGNPVMDRVGYHSNRDFFRNKNISRQYSKLADIVVDFKEKTNLKYTYISDAGYSWNLISNPENNDIDKSIPDIPLKGFDGILELIEKGDSIILSTHPHRWKKSRWGIYLRITFFKIIRTSVQIARKIPFVEKILSRFYFLAKKI